MKIKDYQSIQDLCYQYTGSIDNIIDFMKTYKLINFDYDISNMNPDFIYSNNSISKQNNISSLIVRTAGVYDISEIIVGRAFSSGFSVAFS